MIEFLQQIRFFFFSVTKCQDKATILDAILCKNIQLIIFPLVLPLLFSSQILLEILDQRKGHKGHMFSLHKWAFLRNSAFCLSLPLTWQTCGDVRVCAVMFLKNYVFVGHTDWNWKSWCRKQKLFPSFQGYSCFSHEDKATHSIIQDFQIRFLLNISTKSWGVEPINLKSIIVHSTFYRSFRFLIFFY